MTDKAVLSAGRRWAQLALAAVIIMYGIGGFPSPDDSQPQQAAAHRHPEQNFEQNSQQGNGANSGDTASIDSIRRNFLENDGVNGRDGRAGVNALNDYLNENPSDTNTDGVSRNAMNYAQCVSFRLGCTIDMTDNQILDITRREGITHGYEDGRFGGSDSTTNWQNNAWMNRCPNSVCSRVPEYRHNYATPGNVYRNPPVDPPVIAISRNEDDEDVGSMRIVLFLADEDFHDTVSISQPVAVTVTTSDGTATAGSDYSEVNRRVTIPAGSESVLVPVPVTDDTTVESDETFKMTLSNPSWNAVLGDRPTQTFTIIDNDLPAPGLVENFAAVCSIGDTSGSLTLTWEPPSSGTVPGGYQVFVEDANDRQGFFGSRNVSGRTTHTFTAPDLGWGTYTVQIHSFHRTGNIQANFGQALNETVVCQPPLPMVSLDDTTLDVDEGSSVTITASLDIAPTGTAWVFSTISGAATGFDCTTVPGTDLYLSPELFTFSSGDTSASVTLHACDDDDTDDGTVSLTLASTGINGLQIGSPAAAQVAIIDVGCPDGEHHHDSDPDADGAYCHSNDHMLQPLCAADTSQTWRQHVGGGHTDRIVAACPPPQQPDPDGTQLTAPAGLRLTLERFVDATAANPREFSVTTSNDGCHNQNPVPDDCAEPGVHYHSVPQQRDEDCSDTPDGTNDVTTLTFTSPDPQTIRLCTFVTSGHGTSDRTLDIILQDTHPLRQHIRHVFTVTLEPPMRGVL